jgi:hypothetical protein
MPEKLPVDVIIGEVNVQMPMSGAAMQQRLDELKKKKEVKAEPAVKEIKRTTSVKPLPRSGVKS